MDQLYNDTYFDLFYNYSEHILNSTYDSYTYYSDSHGTYYTRFEFEYYGYLYVCTPLAFLTFVSSIVATIVFFSPSMRNTTTTVLAAIVLADMFAGISDVPSNIALYKNLKEELLTKGATGMDYVDEISNTQCKIMTYFRYVLYGIFRTISNISTIVLAINILTPVLSGHQTRNIFARLITYCALAIIVLLSVILFCFPMMYMGGKLSPYYCGWLFDNTKWTGIAYAWTVEAIQHYLPIFVLLCLLGPLIWKYYKTYRHQSFRRGDFHFITIVLVALFLLQELPLAVFHLVRDIHYLLNSDIMLSPEGYRNQRIIYLTKDIVVAVISHIKFYLFLGLNTKFLSSLKRIFCCKIGSMVTNDETSIPLAQL